MTLRAFQYAAGDVNMDQQVSPDDINLILRAQVRRQPLHATWAQGDVDNDQDVDPDDINLILRGRRYDRGTYGEPAPATASTLGGAATSLTVASAPAAWRPRRRPAAGNRTDGKPTVTSTTSAPATSASRSTGCRSTAWTCKAAARIVRPVGPATCRPQFPAGAR